MCVFVHIGVDFGVACSEPMAIPEPVKRNSNSAVPLFYKKAEQQLADTAFLYICKKSCIFAPVIRSTPWDYVLWVGSYKT